MEAKETFNITEEYREDLDNILSKSPLYQDMSLAERENFMRYLACVVLH